MLLGKITIRLEAGQLRAEPNELGFRDVGARRLGGRTYALTFGSHRFRFGARRLGVGAPAFVSRPASLPIGRAPLPYQPEQFPSPSSGATTASRSIAAVR